MLPRLLCALWLSMAPVAVFAHSTVRSTEPASGTILPMSPPEIVIHFDGPTRLISVAVSAAGADERKLSFEPKGDAASFTIAAPELVPGRNEVVWRALSKDGHPISGTIILVIKPAAKKP